MIYFIQQNVTQDGPIKIGVSENPDTRISQFQTATPERLTLRFQFLTANDYKVESILHNAWSHFNVRGEWYDLTSLQEYDQVQLFRAVWDIVPRKFLCSPCSFCNEYPDDIRIDVTDHWYSAGLPDASGIQLECQNCGSRGPSAPDISLKSAVYQWNRYQN